jgi:hypothetical protein
MGEVSSVTSKTVVRSVEMMFAGALILSTALIKRNDMLGFKANLASETALHLQHILVPAIWDDSFYQRRDRVSHCGERSRERNEKKGFETWRLVLEKRLSSERSDLTCTEMMRKIRPFTRSWSTMKSSIRSGLWIERILLVGETLEKVGSSLNVWRMSKRCGQT